MTTSTPTPAVPAAPAGRARRVRPSNQYWDFRTLTWEVAPPQVPAPRQGG